jgi:hypothetical protein
MACLLLRRRRSRRARGDGGGGVAGVGRGVGEQRRRLPPPRPVPAGARGGGASSGDLPLLRLDVRDEQLLSARRSLVCPPRAHLPESVRRGPPTAHPLTLPHLLPLPPDLHLARHQGGCRSSRPSLRNSRPSPFVAAQGDCDAPEQQSGGTGWGAEDGGRGGAFGLADGGGPVLVEEAPDDEEPVGLLILVRAG